MSDYPPPPPNDPSYTGDHGYPGNDGYPLARLSKRVWARIIDGMLFAVPLTIYAMTHIKGKGADAKLDLASWIPYAVLGVSALYEITCVALWGQTVGKRLMKIRVVRFLDETIPGFAYATMRHLLPAICGAFPVPALSFVLPIIVYAKAFTDPNRQGYHDRVAGTKVVVA